MDDNFFPDDMWSDCLEKAAPSKAPVIADPPILHNAADMEWLVRTIADWQRELGSKT